MYGREPDRRRHTRIEPKGTVTIHALGNAHRGRLANIGLGGVYVATDVSLPDRLLGRVVDLDVERDAGNRESGKRPIADIADGGATESAVDAAV